MTENFSPALEKALFTQMVEQVHTWEKAPASHLVRKGRNGLVGVYRDNGTYSNDYGITIGTCRAEHRRGATLQTLADMTRPECYSLLNRGFRENLGIDLLPLALQGQMFDFAINRKYDAIDTFNDMLVEKGYVKRSQCSNLRITPAVAEAAERFYEKEGAVGANNALVAERKDYYSTHERAKYQRGLRRRAGQFHMDNDIENYREQGFVIDTNAKGKKIVLLPEPVDGPDGKPSVLMPDGSYIHYDQWYGEYMLERACAGRQRSARASKGWNRSEPSDDRPAPREEGSGIPAPPLATNEMDTKFWDRVRKIGDSASGKTTEGFDAAVRNDKSIITALQTRLAEVGYYDGPIDGIASPAFNDAWKGYEKQFAGFVQGIRADGLIGGSSELATLGTMSSRTVLTVGNNTSQKRS